ncbi:hypothetical protein DCE93_00935 [Agromyces badenianii]|uniref:Uncharacterized protein n=1 Tax=Agromyces badenianii TaxID=2080742 RepID=A0A2S0WSX2_9MICO|nr:hypothetical protein [Agromyces badenianii]AWB94412.1 hypothetical protein DCE93_00935 [Agromyces badenianii]
MAAGAKTIEGGVRVRWAHPDDFDRERALHLLGGAERARAAGTVNGAQRDRFLLGRMLLRELAADVAETGDIGPGEIEIRASCERCGAEHGRPSIVWPDAAGPPPLASLASCAELVIAAVAPAGSHVGVDIERGRAEASRDAENERRRAVTRLIGGSSRSAIRRWVRTEAVLKADGRGLRVEPGAVSFERGVARIEDGSTRYRIIDLRVEGCLVSVAVADPG